MVNLTVKRPQDISIYENKSSFIIDNTCKIALQIQAFNVSFSIRVTIIVRLITGFLRINILDFHTKK